MTYLRRVAIIDLGSNTARLVVLGYEPERSYRLLDELREVVRLSAGMGEERILRAEAFERGIGTLMSFRSYCDAAGIEEVRATATSAVREAANGESFLAAARERAGLELDVLSGEEEARAGLLAVANSFALEDALIFDLGGGSVQLSLMRQRRFVQGSSWPLGAVRTTEAFIHSDPPKKKELKALQKQVREALGSFLEEARGLPLVGMGGTLRNLADIAMKKSGYPLELLHGYRFGKAALAEVVDELGSRPLAERRNLPGLNADRADIIMAGGVVVRELLELQEAEEVLISGQGIREGLFYPYLFPRTHLAEDVRRFSVLNLMRRYYDHPAHNEQVRRLALGLFDGLAPLHGYGALERELLACGALLHDIGMAINYYDHHKHGFFLTMSAPLPGFSHREQALIALLVRYHRKGSPSEQGLGGLLLPDDMARVGKLSGLLRLAEYLERSKAQRVQELRCHLGTGYLQVEAVAAGDISTELREAKLHSDLLASAYGLEVEVVQGS